MARPRHGFLIIVLLLLLPMSHGSAMAADKAIAQFEKLVLKRKYEKSAAVLEAAANAGNAEAQYRLGILYRIGVGVGRDDQQARRWLDRAAKNGDEPAGRLLAQLNQSVPPPTKLAGPQQMPAVSAFVPPVQANDRDKAGLTWMERAAARGQLPALASFLKSAGVAKTRTDAETPLLLASTLGMASAVTALLKAGASVDEPDPRGRSPLMRAAAFGHSQLADILIAAGADLNLQDASGATALTYALKNCKTVTAAVLLKHNALRLSDNDGNSPLHLAARYCHDHGLIATLAPLQDVNSADATGRTALWYAAALGDAGTVGILLNQQARSDIADIDGLTPLHAAASRGQAAVIESLLVQRADASATTIDGNTPLMLAAAAKCSACITALAPQKNGINAANRFGDTALIFATRVADAKAVRVLMGAGADPLARNGRRETAVSIAENQGDSVLTGLLIEQ